MRRLILLSVIVLVSSISAFGQLDSLQLEYQKIENSLVYEDGIIELESGNAILNTPIGFRFLNKEQANYVLSDLWGNPLDETIIGMLVPENVGVLDSNSWVFTVSFDEMGYVKDEDADDIDYDDLLEEQQEEFEDSNPERIELGYEPIDFVGWASVPYYDKEKKILHWAKELKFGDQETNTLNYNLRVLGRKGVFMINAVASMNELASVESNIDKVITSVEFKEGHKYADFMPDVDNVAAWTLGGLVAGKILTKFGLLAVLLKFWKLIAVAVAGFGGTLWKKLTGKKDQE